jgi:hypothetical protein
MLDHLNRTLHRLNLGEQFVLFPVPLFEELINVELVCESRTVVVDVLNRFSLYCRMAGSAWFIGIGEMDETFSHNARLDFPGILVSVSLQDFV